MSPVNIPGPVEESDVDVRIDDVKDFVRRRRSVSRDRTTGSAPVTIDVLGDDVRFRAATGDVKAGATVTVYLTDTREIGGTGLFGSMPMVVVRRDGDNTAGGMTRADSPPTPAKNITLCNDGKFQDDLKWLGANEVWAVEITNNDTVTTGYIVQAWGET